MYSTRYYCPILIKLVFSQQFFEKIRKYQTSCKSVSGCRVVPCGQTDEWDKLVESNRRFSQFCEYA